MPSSQSLKMRTQNKRIRVLNQEILMYQQIMKGMRSTLPLEDLLKMVITSVCTGMGLRRAGVFLVEQDGQHIRLALGINPGGKWEKSASRFPIRPRRGYNDQSDLIFGYKKYLLSNNVSGRYKEGMEDQTIVYNMAVVPIYAGQRRPIGNLAVDNLNHYRRITLSDVAFLTDYATLLGLAIQSTRHYEQAVRLSNTDPLTGLHNRRFFERAMEREIQRCHRYRRPFGLIMADIDHFKKVNDTYGHDAGDEVLKQVSSLLKACVRGLDTVARLGGEEFVLLLPETPPGRMKVVVKRLLQKVRETTPPVAAMAEAGHSVTFSLGVVSCRAGNPSTRELLNLADHSLYRAKNNGRNRSGPIRYFPPKLKPWVGL
jgi:diguanylate cyclase (GGDEF)-like protein